LLARSKVESKQGSCTETQIEKEIKQLKAREKSRQQFRKIRQTLGKGFQAKGLARVDIRQSDTEEPYLAGPDPKRWKGPWTSITEPTKIANHAIAANKQQHSQAQQTPFGSEPLLLLFSFKADQPAVSQLLQDKLDFSLLPPSLFPEMGSILKTLSRPPRCKISENSNLITPHHFTSVYKALNKATSSSPSGRHIGHYKGLRQTMII